MEVPAPSAVFDNSLANARITFSRTTLTHYAQRFIDLHPAREVEGLTPRYRKDRFAANPLRSDFAHADTD